MSGRPQASCQKQYWYSLANGQALSTNKTWAAAAAGSKSMDVHGADLGIPGRAGCCLKAVLTSQAALGVQAELTMLYSVPVMAVIAANTMVAMLAARVVLTVLALQVMLVRLARRGAKALLAFWPCWFCPLPWVKAMEPVRAPGAAVPDGVDTEVSVAARSLRQYCSCS